MHLLRAPGRLAALVAALALLAVLAPAASMAKPAKKPQCSDGIDNDTDGAIDGFDSGCGPGQDDDETDSPYAGVQFITVALPLLTLQGTVDGKGVVRVSRLAIRAKRGSTVDVTCKGRHCPFKQLRTTILTTSLRLRKLERKLRPSMLLRFRIQYGNDTLGKYVSYRVRRNNTPKRVDSCIDPRSGKVRGCFVG